MCEQNLSSEQFRILIAELGDARDKVSQIDRLLVGAGCPEGDVIKNVQMVIEQRDKYKKHLEDLLKAIGDDSADRIIADYRVPMIKLDGENN